MEDTHTIRDDLKFYGVYDGHGGEAAANILQEVSESIIICLNRGDITNSLTKYIYFTQKLWNQSHILMVRSRKQSTRLSYQWINIFSMNHR